MRRPLVAGNWKMNGTLASIGPLVESIKCEIGTVQGVDVALCPPCVYLAYVAGKLAGGSVFVGAQNVSHEQAGAFTGEVSGAMLRDYNCEYVIVGHSERRVLYGEDDELAARKFAQAVRVGLKPILCVGETLEDREAGGTEDIVARQLQAVLDFGRVAAFEEAAIAYEPVWAIGTGKTATPAQAQAVHAFIRELMSRYEPDVAKQLRILYGGSVKAANAASLFAMEDIDGGLIGGASLQADEFLSICRAAQPPEE